jgi:hypothetical protein
MAKERETDRGFMVKLCQTESANALENGWKNTKFELGFRRIENQGSAETWKDL